jgi:DNA-binding response OmpR family regulator
MEKRKKVLLAEESGALQSTEVGIRARGDMEVFTAVTAEDALETHRAEKVDFIVASLDLPKMGGDKLCSTIRADDALRRVYVTLICSGNKAELERCGACGANNYIKRPLSPEEIIERVVRVLELSGKRADRVLIKVSVKGIYNNESFFCTSHNISVSGILMETDKVLAKGDDISCSFFLPDDDRVQADGRVVRVTKAEGDSAYAYGVEFTRVGEESMMVLQGFVARLMGH